MTVRVSFFIAVVVLAGVARAANLVPNPDFDGLDGWSMSGTTGTMTLDTNIGFPSAPSLHLSADTINPTLGAGAVSQCIVADDVTRYDFLMTVSGAGLSGGINAFSDGECTTLIGSVSTPGYRSASGTLGVVDFVLPGGTQSARAAVGVFANPGMAGHEGDALFDHILFGPTGTILDGINMNQEGLTGTWYDPTTSGQGLQFVVRPDDENFGEGVLFGAWYTYDVEAGGAETQRWYSIQAQVATDTTIAHVTIYQNTGGMLDAPPATTAVAIGTGTLRFGSCTFGELTYDLDDGRSGAIAFNRLLPNVDCVETGLPINPPSDAGFSGSWYDPALGGQGLILDVVPSDANAPGTQVFGGWYTYAADGTPDSGAAGQRWFSVQGANTINAGSSSLTVYESTGGTFDSSATTVDTVPVGTVTLTFNSCTSATLDYAFDAGTLAGASGSIALSRLGEAPRSCATTN